MKIVALAVLVLLALAGLRELLRAMSQTEKPLPNVDWTGWDDNGWTETAQ